MPELEDQLKALIDRYGAGEIRKHVARLTGPPKRSVRKTAIEYVTDMSVPAVHKERLLTLARHFDQGRFLPSTSDIRNLFHSYGKPIGVVKARHAAIPIVFKLLASSPTDQLDKILSQCLFFGPAELGPIAEAIKATGTGRRTTKPQEPIHSPDSQADGDAELKKRTK